MEANAELKEVKQLQLRKLTTFEGGKYSDELRMCVMELLSHNVAILRVVPVIQSVLKLAGVTCNRLPKHTAINDMLIEVRALSQMQLAEVLHKKTTILYTMMALPSLDISTLVIRFPLCMIHIHLGCVKWPQDQHNPCWTK